jgi:hypothetical protein
MHWKRFLLYSFSISLFFWHSKECLRLTRTLQWTWPSIFFTRLLSFPCKENAFFISLIYTYICTKYVCMYNERLLGKQHICTCIIYVHTDHIYIFIYIHTHTQERWKNRAISLGGEITHNYFLSL